MPKRFEVEKILAKEKVNEKSYYLVQWVGFSRKESTWEPLENLRNYTPMIKRFEKYSTSENLDGLPDINTFVKVKEFTKMKRKELTNNEQQIIDSSLSQSVSNKKEQQVSSQDGTQIDNIMRQFEEEFQIIFTNLKKKLRAEGLHPESNQYGKSVQPTQVACQTNSPQLQHIRKFKKPLKLKKLKLISQELVKVQQQEQNQGLCKEREQNQEYNKKQNNQEQVQKSKIKTSLNSSKQNQVEDDDIIESDQNNNKNNQGYNQCIEIQQNVQVELIEQEAQTFQPLSQQSKIKSYHIDFGSFDKGNQIESIIKGLEDQDDGVNKYLIKWRQGDNQQNFLESWVKEQVMVEYACKDLALFFLSRIKWGKDWKK